MVEWRFVVLYLVFSLNENEYKGSISQKLNLKCLTITELAFLNILNNSFKGLGFL